MLTMQRNACQWIRLEVSILKIRSHHDILAVWTPKADLNISCSWLHGDERAENTIQWSQCTTFHSKMHPCNIFMVDKELNVYGGVYDNMMYMQLYLHALKFYIAQLNHMENAFRRLRILVNLHSSFFFILVSTHCPSQLQMHFLKNVMLQLNTV